MGNSYYFLINKSLRVMILGDAEVALNFLNLKENKFLFSFWIKTLSLKYNNDRFLLFISNLEIILIDNLIDLK